MDRNASQVVIWVIAIAVVVLLGTSAYQNLRLNGLSADQEDTAAEIDTINSELQAQQETIEAGNAERESLESDVAILSRIVRRVAGAGGGADDADLLSVDDDSAALAPGIYILAAAQGEGSTDIDRYTVYHAAATVSAGDFSRDIHFGVARSGFLSWQFYFDYDNDGTVDSDMVQEFIESIPFGGFVSGPFDTERSQAVYDRFLLDRNEANHIPPELIEEQGGEIARQMWGYITSSSEQLADWVMSTLPDEAPAAEAE